MLRRLKRARLDEWTIPLLLALPLLWALLPGGLLNTADGRVHFTRAAEMVHAWQDGIPIPRWSQHLGFGYGIPLFVYAPPLPYFLTAALYTLDLPAEVAYKGMLALTSVIGASGAYQLGRLLPRPQGSRWAGAVTATMFLYAPILLRELFVQGNAAQLLAWVFLPWAAWAVVQSYRTHRGGYMAALALALMGAVLSHNAAALLMMGMVAGLGSALWLATRDGRGLALSVGGSVLGLALSAWFWLPALLEGKYVALDRIAASDYRPRFIALAELLAWPPRLDTSAINPYIPLSWGLLQVIAAGVGVVAGVVWLGVLSFRAQRAPGQAEESLRFGRAAEQRDSSSQTPRNDNGQTRHNDRHILVGTGVFMALLAAFCGFMATRYSEPVWAVLPFVDLFEWPFRWHGMTALGLAWLAGAGVAGLGRLGRWIEAATGLPLTGLALGAALVYLHPHTLPPGRYAFSPAEVVRYEVRSHAVGTTSLGEFNPIWRDGTFGTSPLVDAYLDGQPIDRMAGTLPPGATGHALDATAHRQRYQVNLPAAATVTLNQHYFPGWRAFGPDGELAIRPATGTGLLMVDLPAGDYVLTLRFGETPLRAAADGVSAIAWVALIVVGGWAVVYRRYSRPTGVALTPASPHRNGLAVAGVTAVVATILILQIGFPGLFMLASPPDTALPAQVDRRADFGGKLRLLGLDRLPTTVAPGDWLTVVAYWRVIEDLDDDYSVFLHLDDPITGQTVASVTQLHPSEIPTSDWETGQYVRNSLRLTVPPAADPIQYALRVGFTDPRTGDLLPVAEPPGDVLEIGRVWVNPRSRVDTPDGPSATYGESIHLLGATLEGDTLVMAWRTDAALAADYSIFVHLLDDADQLIGQADGAPYANRYPLYAWRPGQVILDRRDLAVTGADLTRLAAVVVGVYDPAAGARLPAVDAAGAALPDNALRVPQESH
jgi:hypothetical protein